ncbi:MAG: hypothetical protein AAGI66_04475 [Cyanobacteria bacterium P01_H01_bin.74]
MLYNFSFLKANNHIISACSKPFKSRLLKNSCAGNTFFEYAFVGFLTLSIGIIGYSILGGNTQALFVNSNRDLQNPGTFSLLNAKVTTYDNNQIAKFIGSLDGPGIDNFYNISIDSETGKPIFTATTTGTGSNTNVSSSEGFSLVTENNSAIQNPLTELSFQDSLDQLDQISEINTSARLKKMAREISIVGKYSGVAVTQLLSDPNAPMDFNHSNYTNQDATRDLLNFKDIMRSKLNEIEASRAADKELQNTIKELSYNIINATDRALYKLENNTAPVEAINFDTSEENFTLNNIFTENSAINLYTLKEVNQKAIKVLNSNQPNYTEPKTVFLNANELAQAYTDATNNGTAQQFDNRGTPMQPKQGYLNTGAEPLNPNIILDQLRTQTQPKQPFIPSTGLGEVNINKPKTTNTEVIQTSTPDPTQIDRLERKLQSNKFN